MRNNLLLIDGNNLLHRSYYRHNTMKSSDGTPSGIVFGFTHVLRSLVKLHKPKEVIVLFDGGSAKERKAVLPDYKKRDKKEDFDYEDFKSQKQATEKILSYLGIPVLYKKGVEADDLIWLLARKYKRKYHIVLVSTDKDFHQLLSKNFSIWQPSLKVRLTHKNLSKHFNYTPEQCVDYLILDGDKSDNIPGYAGIGPKRAISFLDKYGSIKKYLLTKREEDSLIKRSTLEELYIRNRLLIDIRLFCRRHLKLKTIPYIHKKGNKIKMQKLRNICIDYSITTFIKPDFLSVFHNLLK